MCIVCVLIDKERITKKEAKKALWEQINFAQTEEEVKHIQELYSELEQEEDYDTI